MDIAPPLNNHGIGFPWHIHSKRDEDNKNDKEIGGQDSELANTYKPLYELSNNYLENGYSILYLAESLPNETAKANVVENIQNVNVTNNSQNVKNNISKGLLTVIDSEVTYQANATSKDIVDFLYSNLRRMQRKLQDNTKGAMIINCPDPFFKRDKYDVFMMFEEEVGKMLPKDVGLLCWYKKKWLSNLSLAHAIDMLVHHKYTIHEDWKYKEWDSNKIIDVLSKGIDKNLGEGSSILLFQTMKSSYKLNRNVIVSRPDIFEETLKQLLDKEEAKSVIDSIFQEIIKEVAFHLTSNNSLDKRI
jgi:hypothetical protein